jgi:lipopolysaccharide biosynthesis glycosyltransferase
MSRNLIYFVVGANPEYALLLKTCLESIRATCNNIEDTDILIMCDQQYVKHVEAFNTLIHVTEPNLTGVDASMRKVCIFDYANIHDYDKVMYLDCDIVVCNDLAKLFYQIRNPETLYTCSEVCVPHPHENILFSLLSYTPEQLEYLNSTCKPVFNCGQFAFVQNEIMRNHFSAVRHCIKTTKDANLPYFYEQSFMNHHFNINGKIDDSVFTPVTDLRAMNNSLSDENLCIAHFATANIPWDVKLLHMREKLQSLTR